MPNVLWIDIETKSSLDLRKSNVYRYVEDEHFDILMAAWAWNDGPIEVAFGDEISFIPGIEDHDVLKVAHNAAFERVCFSRFFGLPVGEYLPPEQWRDTMAIVAENGYPRSLKSAAKATGAEDKDEAGTALINLFCKPNRRGTFNLPEDKPEKWAQFVEYCRQDVATMRDIARKVGLELPTYTEQRVYEVDQRVNDNGIKVDLELVHNAIEAAEDNRADQAARVVELTGVDNPYSPAQLLEWLNENGCKIPNLTAETVQTKMKAKNLHPVCREVLELRLELALVAFKKYEAALNAVNSDGRYRGSFQFFGAHTGRWSGRGVQLQNLARGFSDDESVENAVAGLEMGLGASPDAIKKLVRSMFVGPFTVVDYSSIEARVVAWLAGEQWALDAFAGGRDIYVETAKRMSTPGNELTRAQGKVAVLALGYNGGIKSLRVMGGEGTDVELKALVKQWRDANPKIVAFWKSLEDAFYSGNKRVGRIRVEKVGKDRYVYLPSGRPLVYHDVQAKMVDGPYGPRRRIHFQGNQGFRVDTYGGRLTENVTQAVARDILAEALVRLHDDGYKVVGHVHDEILVEGDHSVEEVSAVMCAAPAWAAGMPINGDGFRCARYRKD